MESGMSESTRFHENKEFKGPFAKVGFGFRYHGDSKRDALTITLYDDRGVAVETIYVNSDSTIDGCVLLHARTNKGKTF